MRSVSIATALLAVLATVPFACIGASRHEDRAAEYRVPSAEETRKLRRDRIANVFRDHPEALENADRVLEILRSQETDRNEQLKPLIGTYVAFTGGGGAPGKFANLYLDNHILLDVQLSPPIDPRPQAVIWEAQVLGKLKAVSFEEKIIFIEANVKDWVMSFCG